MPGLSMRAEKAETRTIHGFASGLEDGGDGGGLSGCLRLGDTRECDGYSRGISRARALILWDLKLERRAEDRVGVILEHAELVGALDNVGWDLDGPVVCAWGR